MPSVTDEQIADEFADEWPPDYDDMADVDDGPRCQDCGASCEYNRCDRCQDAIDRTCPGYGDDLCSGDPDHCGLCRSW